jgi:hypothetical protein
MGATEGRGQEVQSELTKERGGNQEGKKCHRKKGGKAKEIEEDHNTT